MVTHRSAAPVVEVPFELRRPLALTVDEHSIGRIRHRVRQVETGETLVQTFLEAFGRDEIEHGSDRQTILSDEPEVASQPGLFGCRLGNLMDTYKKDAASASGELE